MQRVKQVLSAILAEVTPQDVVFVAQYLNQAEQDLFYRMSLPDRRHCLNVAYTATTLAEGIQNVNRTILIKSALLHDVGRRQGDVSTWDKIIAVLGRAAFGNGFIKNWGRLGRGGILQNLRHALYVSANHPSIGAALLQLAGTEEQVIDVVRRHHLPAEPADSQELVLLRQADDLN